MSWRRLQHAFSVTILRLPRRLEDVLKTSSKTSSRRLGRRKIVTLKACRRRLEDMPWRRYKDMSWRRFEDVLKMFQRHLLKTSWIHYGDKQSTYWGYLYLTNLNVYLRNLYLADLHLTILKRVQNALSRTRQFNISLILEHKQHLYFKN